MAEDNSTQLWLNGYIILGTNIRIDIQEVTVNQSRDLNENYNAGASKASALVPGKEKIEFTIKRVFSNTTMMAIYQARCQFDMILANNSNNPGPNNSGEKVCALTGCMLSQNNLGTLGSGEAVTEDIQGKALDVKFEKTEIASIVNPDCALA